MEKGKIRPLATPKPLKRSSQKLACVIMSWIPLGMQHFVAIGSGVSAPQIRDFSVHFDATSMFVFWGFFNKATAYTLERIFTQNTSFRVRKCLLGVKVTIFNIYTLVFPKNRHFGNRF